MRRAPASTSILGMSLESLSAPIPQSAHHYPLYRPPPPLDLDDASIPVKVRSATPLRQLRGSICGSDKGTSQRPRLDRGLSGASPRLGLHRCPHWPEHHRHPLGLASRRRRSFIRTRRLPTSFRSTPSGYPRDKSLRGEGRGRLGRGQRRPRPPTPCSCPALPPAGNAPAPVPGRSPVASLMLGPRIERAVPIVVAQVPRLTWSDPVTAKSTAHQSSVHERSEALAHLLVLVAIAPESGAE